MLAGALLALFSFPSGVQLKRVVKIRPGLNLACFGWYSLKNKGIFEIYHGKKKNIERVFLAVFYSNSNDIIWPHVTLH